jgi:hypothetical protein
MRLNHKDKGSITGYLLSLLFNMQVTLFQYKEEIHVYIAK